MKKLLLICYAVFALVSCGKDDSSENQAKYDYDSIILEPYQSHFLGYSASTTIKFESSADWNISFFSEHDWLTVEPMQGSAGNAELKIDIAPYYSYRSLARKAAILIRAGNATNKIDISQELLLTTINTKMDPTYSSTDFSQDGEISVMQYANVSDSKAINVVFMGDGFTDRLIADGTYDNIMRMAMEAFFTYEPYKSFRDYFTCHTITLVSKDETIAEGHETALQSVLDPGSTRVGGDNEKVIRYIYEKLGFDEEMDDVVAVVVVNSTSHHGACHMYSPDNWYFDGSGFAIAYSAFSCFGTCVTHEFSHGFAKLADEYVNDGVVLTEEDKYYLENFYKDRGWYKNIDITDDPEKIKWSHFLSDSRYASDDIGIFEGAKYCAEGVYRPSVNSMMRESYEGYGFNAPSREAIYHRIHKIAYGKEWEYDYEEFVKYDAKNIGESRKTRTRSGDDFRYVENITHQSPIIVKHSWRDEIEK